MIHGAIDQYVAQKCLHLTNTSTKTVFYLIMLQLCFLYIKIANLNVIVTIMNRFLVFAKTKGYHTKIFMYVYIGSRNGCFSVIYQDARRSRPIRSEEISQFVRIHKFYTMIGTILLFIPSSLSETE